MSTIKDRIIDIIEIKQHKEYNRILNFLLKSLYCNPIVKFERKYLTYDEFCSFCIEDENQHFKYWNSYKFNVMSDKKTHTIISENIKEKNNNDIIKWNYSKLDKYYQKSSFFILKEIFDKLNPYLVKFIQKDGTIFKLDINEGI